MTAKHQERRRGPSRAKLDEMIDEAIADAYREPEQTVGFFTLLEDRLKLPLNNKVLGISVTVERLDMTEEERIVAGCLRGKARQRVPILDLRLPCSAPEGREWIEAFHRWA